MNLAAVNYWATEEPFIDRFKTSGAWTATGKDGADATSTLQFDANGYPVATADLANVWTMVNVDPHDASPNNQYVLTWSGSASVKVGNSTVISSEPGKVVFEVDASSSDYSAVQLMFRNLSATDTVTDIHVVRTDQVGLFNTGELFNPAFVEKVAQWDVVRFMDWQGTNGFKAVDWSTRTTLTDASWAGAQTTDGVPIEAMVKLANEAHVDMWYNVPTLADDAYVTKALAYIRDNLASGLKVHVEYSNEVWNTSFRADDYAQAKANDLWGVDANQDGVINGAEVVAHGANYYYGYRSAQIADIARHVFGSEAASRLVEVLAGQSGNADLLTRYIVPGVERAGLGSASSLFQDYAVAPYFGSQFSTPTQGSADQATILGWARSGAAGLDAAFRELEFGGSLTRNSSVVSLTADFVKSKAAAVAAGLNYVTYEGGLSLTSTKYSAADKADVQALFQAMADDPRMGDLYAKMLTSFVASGGMSYVAFNDAQKASDSGVWGALANIYEDSSPRYDALLAALSGGTSLRHVGSSGAETISALKVGGVINGMAGDDVIIASSGNDNINGGEGNDRIIGSSSTMIGKSLVENDFYSGGTGSDTIFGGAGNDHIYGNSMTTVAGEADSGDVLNGGAGNDYINGNAGADVIDGGSGNDRLYGGADADTIKGSSGSDYLQGNKGNDSLSGGDGNDQVRGGADNDIVMGDAGHDSLFGDAGNDTLIGGKDVDLMVGGAGNDTFVFAVKDASFAAIANTVVPTDEITDFAHGVDHISLGFQVAHLFQGSAATQYDACVWAIGQMQAHHSQTDVIAVTVGSDTFLFYDSTGTGTAMDSAIKVDHLAATSFTVGDFV